MNPIERKQNQILAYERRFAYKLGEHVLEKPKMSIWMILIPIIIVYHMFRFQKYVSGRNKFALNYLKSREQAMESALAVVAEGRAKDVKSIAEQMPMLPETRTLYCNLLSVLVDHYVELLRAEGENIDSLLRSVYRSRTDYLLFFNQLSQAEKQLNSALRPHLAKEHQGIEQAITRIEKISESMRREEVLRVFP
jgi:hypothetical protein